MILESITKTQSEVHTQQFGFQLRNIFEVSKPSEKLRYSPFDKKMHNKFLLWQGIRTQSLPSVLRNGIRMPSNEAAQTGFMFGKGIYFFDCFSKAALQSMGPERINPGQTVKAFLLLSEVALGDMHLAFAPYQFKRSAPMFCHSVYGVGRYKPKKIGIRDLVQPAPAFAPNQLTYDKPGALFLNTGKMDSNSDLDQLPSGTMAPDLKFNEYVVYDESQVRLRFLVEVDLVVK